MSNGLGLRRNEFTSRTPAPAIATTTAPVKSTASVDSVRCALRPAGFLVTLFFALAGPVAPLVFLYNSGLEADYSLDDTRALTASTAAVGGLVVLLFRDPKTLYNLALSIHLGFEIFLIDRAFAFASDPLTAETSAILARLGGAVVAAHLVPFYLLNHVVLLSVLAYVGIVVNTLLILLAMPALGSQLLFVVALTSSAVLVGVLHVEKPALIPMASLAIREKTCVHLDTCLC